MTYYSEYYNVCMLLQVTPYSMDTGGNRCRSAGHPHLHQRFVEVPGAVEGGTSVLGSLQEHMQFTI